MKSDKEIKVSDDFWSKVQVTKKENKKPVHLRIDADVFRFFYEESKGKGHIRKMQDVLAAYVKIKRGT